MGDFDRISPISTLDNDPRLIRINLAPFRGESNVSGEIQLIASSRIFTLDRNRPNVGFASGPGFRARSVGCHRECQNKYKNIYVNLKIIE